MAPRFFDTECDEHQDDTATNGWLERLASACLALVNNGSEIPCKEEVKIAVLDTGMDLQHRVLSDQYGKGKPIREFVDFRTDQEPRKTVPVDTAGHGTHVTAILRRVAPMAKIYVARIAEDTSDIKPKAVALAIDHARENWEVDIISMSFGFDDEPADIREAIKAATRSNILLFAAASNHGNTKPHQQAIAFPARWSEHVFCVNATDHYGTRLADFNPSPKSEPAFATLGIKVCSTPASLRPHPHWQHKPDGNTRQHMFDYNLNSGTSIATPIMAGSAALLIHFVKQQVKKPVQLTHLGMLPGFWQDILESSGEKSYMTGLLESVSRYEKRIHCQNVQLDISCMSEGGLAYKIWDNFKYRLHDASNSDSAGRVEAVGSLQGIKTGGGFAHAYGMNPALVQHKKPKFLLSAKDNAEISTELAMAHSARAPPDSAGLQEIGLRSTKLGKLLESLSRELPTTWLRDPEARDLKMEMDDKARDTLDGWLGRSLTPSLWLRGKQAARASQSITAALRKSHVFVVRHTVDRYDGNDFLEPEDRLRRCIWSMTLQVMHYFASRSEDLDLDWRNPNAIGKNSDPLEVLTLLHALLAQMTDTVVWILEDFHLLETPSFPLDASAHYQEALVRLMSAVGFGERRVDIDGTLPNLSLITTLWPSSILSERRNCGDVLEFETDGHFGKGRYDVMQHVANSADLHSQA